MSGARRGCTGWRVIAGVLAVAGLLALLRPWTVRPIRTSHAARFDATVYAAAAWPRVISEATGRATDVRAVIAEVAAASGRGPEPPSAPKGRFVRGSGVVTGTDLGSRVGLAEVRLAGPAPRPTVVLEIGPVLRGTALRDALSFVRFTDFDNQSDFAAVAGALNDLVLQTVLAPIDTTALAGRQVSFAGATSLEVAGHGAPAGTSLEIVPVSLTIEGGGR